MDPCTGFWRPRGAEYAAGSAHGAARRGALADSVAGTIDSSGHRRSQGKGSPRPDGACGAEMASHAECLRDCRRRHRGRGGSADGGGGEVSTSPNLRNYTRTLCCVINPSRGDTRSFRLKERLAVKRIGEEYGCHACGSKVPGTHSGFFVLDHQEPISRQSPTGARRLYPNCVTCSKRQGGWLTQNGGE